MKIRVICQSSDFFSLLNWLMFVHAVMHNKMIKHRHAFSISCILYSYVITIIILKVLYENLIF